MKHFKSFRGMIDLNPSAGDSFWGLTRNQAKTLAIIVISIGLFIADPPFLSILPNEYINLAIAGFLHTLFGLSPIFWLAFVYTVIGWGLIFLGAYIYPHSTMSILHGVLHKFRNAVRKIFKSPWLLLISVAIFVYVFTKYLSLFGAAG